MMAKPQIDQQVITKLRATCAGETDHVTLMEVRAGELFYAFDGFDGVGFCRVVARGILKLGPYHGGHGCLMIPFDKGVCGAAARKQQTQIVYDVHQFDGHIACSVSTQLELVIPVSDKGTNLAAVFDLDSSQPAFFSEVFAAQLETLMAELVSRDKKM